MPVPLLTPESLHRAFVRVKENHGCAGADGVSLSEFEASLSTRLAALRESVEDESYYAWPLRRIEVEKRPGSEERRTLVVPASH
jgi:RNA-directed DNA polymerase